MDRYPEKNFGTFTKIGNDIMAYNNTDCWTCDGALFIDSLKYPRLWQKIALENGYKCEVLSEPTDEAVLFGEEATGLEFGGRKTICFVMKFTK